MSEQNRVPFFREIALLIIGGLLTVSGTLLSSYMTNKNEEERWEKRNQLEFNKQVFEQRIKLVERTVKIINKSDLANFHYIAENGKIELGLLGKGEPDSIIENRKVIAELNSEFLAVLSLNNIYFGPKVVEASKELIASTSEGSPWWKAEEETKQKYINAMYEELFSGLNEI